MLVTAGQIFVLRVGSFGMIYVFTCKGRCFMRIVLIPTVNTWSIANDRKQRFQRKRTKTHLCLEQNMF